MVAGEAAGYDLLVEAHLVFRMGWVRLGVGEGWGWCRYRGIFALDGMVSCTHGT